MSITAAAAGLKWAGLAKVLGQAMTWAVTLIVIRLLSPADFGLLAVATVFVTLIAVVAEFGLGASLVQARAVSDEEAASVAAAALSINATAAAAIAAMSPLIGWFYGDPRIGHVAAVSALALVFNAFATVPEADLYREMRFKPLAIINVGSAALGSVVTLALALLDFAVWSLVIGSLAGTAGRTIALISVSRWVMPRFAPGSLRRHLHFGGTLTASRLAWQGAQQCDMLIGGRILPDAALGLYSVSVQLARLPMHKVMSVINQVAFPAVARMQDDPRGLASRLVAGVGMLGWLAMPLLWGLSSVAPEFVAVFLGEKWVDSALPLQLAALAMPAQLLSNVFSTALTGVGRADVELRNMLVGLMVTVVAVALGAQAGAVGLAAGWGLAAIGALVLNYPRSNRVLGLSTRALLRALRGPVVAGACMYAAVAWGRVLMSGVDDVLRLVALIPVGAVVYVAAVTAIDRHGWEGLRRVAAAMRTA